MLEYATGDLLPADTEALVNTVNCAGVHAIGSFRTPHRERLREGEGAAGAPDPDDYQAD